MTEDNDSPNLEGPREDSTGYIPEKLNTLTIENNPQLLDMMLNDTDIEIVSLSYDRKTNKRYYLSYKTLT